MLERPGGSMLRRGVCSGATMGTQCVAAAARRGALRPSQTAGLAGVFGVYGRICTSVFVCPFALLLSACSCLVGWLLK